MAEVKIVKRSFTDKTTGVITPYKRLVITGSINGEVFSLELKLSDTEMQLASALLSSKEELPVASEYNGEVKVDRVDDSAADDFFQKNHQVDDATFNLSEE